MLHAIQVSSVRKTAKSHTSVSQFYESVLFKQAHLVTKNWEKVVIEKRSSQEKTAVYRL